MQMLKRRSDAIYLTEMGAFIARRITLVFQFLIDGLRDFIADIRNGRPDFSQVRRKLTVINL
ncbi:hypothetical protein JDU57_25175, partial [Escherichia coli]|nr:hypothetical protein [Escherichia coli]